MGKGKNMKFSIYLLKIKMEGYGFFSTKQRTADFFLCGCKPFEV